jgi:hypothetical protein
VQSFATVGKWKQLRHIVTEMQSTAGSLITQAIDVLDDKYPARPPSAGLPIAGCLGPGGGRPRSDRGRAGRVYGRGRLGA